MGREITLALCGANGYGGFYAKELLRGAKERGVSFAACVDPHEIELRGALTAAGVKLFKTLEGMYAQGVYPDLVILSTPPALHCRQTLFCLSKGSHVVCEKPVAATVEDALAMQRAADESGRVLNIGYQWCYSPAVQKLKELFLSGCLGGPRRLKTMVHWPRTDRYYNRTPWAGAIKDGDGNWVLDSPVMNAAAHFLHHSLYVLGRTRDKSATIRNVRAELYRTYPIQNYDTAALHLETHEGVDIFFYVTHAASKFVGPMFHFQFEEADVFFCDYNIHEGVEPVADIRKNTGLVIRYRDGRVENLGDPWADPLAKVWETASAIRDGGSAICSASGAASHLEAVHAVQQFPVTTFREDQVICTMMPGGEVQRWVPGLECLFHACYEQAVLPSDLLPVFESSCDDAGSRG